MSSNSGRFWSALNPTKSPCQVDGYVHNVSDIHTGSMTGTHYIDFSIQENEPQMRVVCFSPEKRQTLIDREKPTKSSVRLMSVSPKKRKYNPESNENIMNKYSKVINQERL